MTDYILLLLLRLVHIGAGVFWVGAFLLLARWILPATHEVGPSAGPLMSTLMQKMRLPVALTGAAVLTVLSGFALYGRNIAATDGAFARTHSGMVFGLGGLAALVALVMGVIINRPVGVRLGVIAGEIAASGGVPTPELRAEMERLQARIAGSSRVISILLMVAVTAMAIGRYV
jgi:hypothetical protein